MRTFIINKVEHFSVGPVNNPRVWDVYNVQMCGDPDGIKAWHSFHIPIENLGEELLPVGTRFTIALESETTQGFQGMDLEECIAARAGVNLRRARRLKKELEEKIGNCGLTMKMPKREWYTVCDAIEKFEDRPSTETAIELLAVAKDASLVWVRDDG